MEFRPDTIRFHEAHAAKPRATRVIRLLLDVGGPDRFRIRCLQRREEGAIRIIAARRSEFAEVRDIGFDKYDFLAIDQQAGEFLLQAFEFVAG